MAVMTTIDGTKVELCNHCLKPKAEGFATICRCGRPTVMTDEVIAALCEAWRTGSSDEDAAAYAGIGTNTLNVYLKKNPEFAARREQLKREPIIAAKRSVVAGIMKDPDLALKYLERREPSEYSPTMKVKGTMAIGLVEIHRQVMGRSKSVVDERLEAGSPAEFVPEVEQAILEAAEIAAITPAEGGSP